MDSSNATLPAVRTRAAEPAACRQCADADSTHDIQARALSAKLNPAAAPFLPGTSQGGAHTPGRIDWADLDSDLSVSDEDVLPAMSRDVDIAQPSGADKAHPSLSDTQHLTDALARSLLIQSFSGLSGQGSSASTSARVSPDSHDSPTPVTRHTPVHSTTVGFSLCTVPEAGVAPPRSPSPAESASRVNARVSVPIDATVSHRHGYAGLLGLAKSADEQIGVVHTPSLHAVDHAVTDVKVAAMLREATVGLEAGVAPEAAREGMGGTYFLGRASADGGGHVAIFKPCDEEPLAPNNPKQWQGRAMGAPGMKPSVRVGEAALREVAAYLLDRDGFAGVPPACLVKCYHPVLNYKVAMPRIESLMSVSALQLSSSCNGLAYTAPPEPLQPASEQAAVAPGAGGLSRMFCRLPPPLAADPATTPAPATPGGRKLGSMQAFAPHKCDANDMAPSHFSAENVHRIGILDIRLMNCDRHTGNLLVQESERVSGGSSSGGRHLNNAPYTLVPIDHGYALPEALDNPYFEWLFWPQTSVPFSDDVKQYVAEMDAQADIAMLREKLPSLREECFRCLETTTKVLQMCVAAGLTLFEIGSLFSRPENNGPGEPSDLELICMDAREDAVLSPDEPGDEPFSSGGTSPSAPASPTSAGLNTFSMGALPAVKESSDDDSDASDSGFMFNMGPSGNGGETSPCVDPVSRRERAPRRSGACDHDSCAGLFTPRGMSPTRQSVSDADVSPAPEHYPFLHTRFASAPFHTPYLGRAMDASREGTAAQTPAPAQSASGVAVSQGPATFGRRGLPRSRRNAWRTKHGQRGNMAAYPPLLPGTHPDQVNYVFTDLTDAQWKVFLARVEDAVDEELLKNTWKAQRMNGPMAGSCPVAFNDRLR